VAGVAVLITLWMRFGAAADNNFTGPDPGQTLLNQHFARQSGDALTLAISSAQPVTAPAVRARVASALVPFERAPYVTGVTDPYTTPGHVSRDGHIAYATVQFSVSGNGISGGETAALMNDASRASGHGVTFSLGGDVVDQAETPYGGPDNGIGVGAAMVVLLIAFGSLLAMGLPVATALLGIGAGLSLIALLGHVFPAPSFSAIVAALTGLGVGVDYALDAHGKQGEGDRKADHEPQGHGPLQHLRRAPPGLDVPAKTEVGPDPPRLRVCPLPEVAGGWSQGSGHQDWRPSHGVRGSARSRAVCAIDKCRGCP